MDHAPILDPSTAAGVSRFDLTLGLIEQRQRARDRTRRANLVPASTKALTRQVLLAPLLTRPGTVRR